MIARVVSDMAAADATLKIQYVDVYGAFEKDTMSADGIHPNADGYANIAKTFYGAIHQYYTGSSGSSGGGSATTPDLPQNFSHNVGIANGIEHFQFAAVCEYNFAQYFSIQFAVFL